MWLPWRAQTTETTADEPPRGVAEMGILPCNAQGCEERNGIACEHLDRRSRLCATAWCPEHRHMVGGHSYCAIHATRRSGITPMLTERAGAVISWFAAAAEDDIVSFLNEIATRSGGVVEAETMRITTGGEGRTWQRAWRVRTGSGQTMRVFVGVGDETTEVITLGVDGDAVRMIPLPVEQLERIPAQVDLEWLLREVVAPLRFAIGVRASDVDASLEGAAYTTATTAAGDRWRWL